MMQSLIFIILAISTQVTMFKLKPLDEPGIMFSRAPKFW